MKHTISSIEYLMAMKGFRHGVARQPMDPSHGDSAEYARGYLDGQKAARIYSESLCKKLGLEDSVIVT